MDPRELLAQLRPAVREVAAARSSAASNASTASAYSMTNGACRRNPPGPRERGSEAAPGRPRAPARPAEAAGGERHTVELLAQLRRNAPSAELLVPQEEALRRVVDPVEERADDGAAIEVGQERRNAVASRFEPRAREFAVRLRAYGSRRSACRSSLQRAELGHERGRAAPAGGLVSGDDGSHAANPSVFVGVGSEPGRLLPVVRVEPVEVRRGTAQRRLLLLPEGGHERHVGVEARHLASRDGRGCPTRRRRAPSRRAAGPRRRTPRARRLVAAADEFHLATADDGASLRRSAPSGEVRAAAQQWEFRACELSPRTPGTPPWQSVSTPTRSVSSRAAARGHITRTATRRRECAPTPICVTQTPPAPTATSRGRPRRGFASTTSRWRVDPADLAVQRARHPDPAGTGGDTARATGDVDHRRQRPSRVEAPTTSSIAPSPRRRPPRPRSSEARTETSIPRTTPLRGSTRNTRRSTASPTIQSPLPDRHVAHRQPIVSADSGCWNGTALRTTLSGPAVESRSMKGSRRPTARRPPRPPSRRSASRRPRARRSRRRSGSRCRRRWCSRHRRRRRSRPGS